MIVESQEDCIVAGLSKQEFSHFLVSIFSKDMPVRNWGQVYAELDIMYPGRLTRN